MSELLKGDTIEYFGKYVSYGEVGRGAMGRVFRVRQQNTQRIVALKLLLPDLIANEVTVLRLKTEVEAIAKLNHPNIVPILEAGDYCGQPYLTMPFVEGESLAEQLKAQSQPASVKEIATILSKIARAVHHAHQRGVLHRDLKPGNILVDGTTGEPHLIDFGLAKCIGQDCGLTLTGAILGTPAFLSPEQAAGRNESITTATDIYGLGAILFALLTGKPPFEGESVSEIISKVVNDDPLPPGKLRSEIPRDVETICLKCLEKEPRRRYETAEDLADDLERFLKGEPIRARPIGTTERLSMWSRRKPAHAALGMVAALLLITIIVAPLLFYRSRAAEGTRGRELLEAQLLRVGLRSAGWTTIHESHLQDARDIRPDAALFESTVAGLVGFEMRPVDWITNVPGSSVAFGKRGQVAFGGLETGNAHLWNPNKHQFEALSQIGDGPVGFDDQDAPLQFIPIGNGRFALRDVRTGEVRTSFDLAGEPKTGNENRPALAMAANISRVAAAVRMGKAGRFAVWDSGSGQLVGEANELVCALALTPDGTLLATGDNDGNVAVRALPGLGMIMKLSVGRSPISSLAFGHNLSVHDLGRTNRHPWLLAVGDNAAAITICDVDTGAIRNTCMGSRYYVSSLAFNPDGTILASAGYPNLLLWDARSGIPLLQGSGEWRITFGHHRALAFSSDGKKLAVATEERFDKPSLSIWEIEENRGVQTLHGLGSQAESVWWSADGSRLAALGHNWDLGIWEMPAGRLTHVLRTPIGESPDNAAMVFFPDGRRIAFAAGQDAFTYDLVDNCRLQTWRFPSGYADSMRYESEKSLLHLHSEIEDKSRGRPHRMWALRNLFGHDPLNPVLDQTDTNWVTWDVTLPLSGNYFLVFGGPSDTNIVSSTVQTLNLNTGEELWSTTNAGRSFRRGRWWSCDTGAKFLIGAPEPNSNRKRLVRLPNGEFIRSIRSSLGTISPSGEQFVDDDNHYFFANAETKHGIALNFQPAAGRAVFSPDGSRFAVTVDRGCVLVMDLKKVQQRLQAMGWKPD